ncbi:peroxiredoxin-like family protein [Aspergillus foveolatus]|uniref:peroxiredoxin-like family protein n=1 Tax=Aspergillus foveolatus TaxID=210207 RepID=UPI003CCD42DC
MPGTITRSPEILPGASDLRDAYTLELQSASGNPVCFGDLILEKGEITTVIIFIRHFFCIYDQDYVRTVSHHLTDSVLQTIPNTGGPIQLMIIGCGDPSLIVPYVSETTGDIAQFPVYSDPDGKLYEKLHMKRTLTNIMRPPVYAQAGFWKSLGMTLRQVWGRGWKGLRGGRWDQNGGEWVIRNGKCVFEHRMENVSDHLTAEKLLEILERTGAGDGKGENNKELAI